MSLEQLNKQQLSNRAKSLGVANFASIKREVLVKAILRALKKKEGETPATKAKPAPKKPPELKVVPKPAPVPAAKPHVNGKTPAKPVVLPNAKVRTQKTAARDA